MDGGPGTTLGANSADGWGVVWKERIWARFEESGTTVVCVSIVPELENDVRGGRNGGRRGINLGGGANNASDTARRKVGG